MSKLSLRHVSLVSLVCQKMLLKYASIMLLHFNKSSKKIFVSLLQDFLYFVPVKLLIF